MAVEIKNKRKRKHEGAVGDDEGGEGLSVLPKKQAKKSLSPMKPLQEDHNDCSEQQEKEIKFSKDFKMMEFRSKLRGNNFMTGL